MPICKVRAVASSRKKDESGNWVDDKSVWVSLTGFNKVAENMAESITKGDLLTVVGRLQVSDWEDSEGHKRTSVEVSVDSIGPAITWNPAKVQRGERRTSTPDEDPWATGGTTDEPPF
jgi:single-strand DNA-binding protein